MVLWMMWLVVAGTAQRCVPSTLTGRRSDRRGRARRFVVRQMITVAIRMRSASSGRRRRYRRRMMVANVISSVGVVVVAVVVGVAAAAAVAILWRSFDRGRIVIGVVGGWRRFNA